MNYLERARVSLEQRDIAPALIDKIIGYLSGKTEARQKILYCKIQGMTFREIGKVVGTSHVAAWKHVEKSRGGLDVIIKNFIEEMYPSKNRTFYCEREDNTDG